MKALFIIMLLATGCVQTTEQPKSFEVQEGWANPEHYIRPLRICIEGKVYYMWSDSLTPKFNDDGTPAKCKQNR